MAMTEFVNGVPAYGADYKTKAEVIEAWNSGKDFKDTNSLRYFSKRDIATMFPEGPVEIHLRYRQLRMVCVITFRK